MKPRLPFLLPVILALAPAAALAADPATEAEDFAVPQAGRVFTFPRDHGSHPDFRLEWWYVTGHLAAVADPGRRFGFQATFFRQAAPRPHATEPAGAFGRDQLFLAHMALLDVRSGAFRHEERLHREGWAAGAATTTLDVRNGDWSLRLRPGAGPGEPERLDLRGGIRAEVALRLSFESRKPLVVFGEDGVSRKGAEPTAASHYLTFTRLATTGVLRLAGPEGPEEVAVTGEAWLDHEFSSSQLGSGQVGWDWLSVHLRDGREVMLYRLRRADGSADPASRLTWIDAAGRTSVQPFTWEIQRLWRSAATDAAYPTRVRVRTTDPVSGAAVILDVEPLAEDQELTGALGGIPYWEGACRIKGADGAELGRGYLELTGHARPLRL